MSGALCSRRLATARIIPSSRLPWGVVAGAIIGGAFLVWLTGLGPLDPTNIDWVMTGDWVPHHFGWAYFRAEPWHWPPGTVRGYYAPLGTSIGLTDSIPIAAYLLKPLAAWLPQPFQYLGLWLLLCYVLQGALAARLVSRWSPSVVVQALGATLFVLMPTLLARVGHAALCAHWLILWAMLLATRAAGFPPGRRFPLAQWAALGLVAGMTQPYLAAMVLPVLFVATLTGGRRAGREPRRGDGGRPSRLRWPASGCRDCSCCKARGRSPAAGSATTR